MEENITDAMLEWFERELPDVIERDVRLPLGDLVVAIIGPRRAGKTFLLFQEIRKLLEKGYEKQNIIYLDFEDIRLSGLRSEHYSLFIKILYEYSRPKGGKIFLFLDEVQSLNEWERWVRSLHNTGLFQIVVTGSSSRLLSREVAEALGGRYISKILLPLSFKEFLRFKGFKERWKSKGMKGRLLALLREYLHFGGFPEVVKKPREEKSLIIKSYFETIFYRDVLGRHRVRDRVSAEIFLRLLISSFGRQFSISAIQKYFKGLGIEKGKKALSALFKMFEEAMFIMPLEKHSSPKGRISQPKKVYPIDPGFLLLKRPMDWGLAMETAVAVKLYKKILEDPFYKVSYWKDYQGREVDFFVEGEELLQVCYNLSDESTLKREVRSLVAAAKETGCERLKVVTWDYEGERDASGYKIGFEPLWSWLLNDS